MRKLSFWPTPVELIAMALSAYFFWFLADSVFKGIVAGVAGVGAGIVLSRLAGLLGPQRRDLGRGVWILVMVGLVLAAPFLTSAPFRITQMAIAGYTAIAVLGLNLLTGYTGQASIGHSAFLGIGGYTTAVMLNETGMSFILAMLIGTAFAALAGLLVGIPALRLSGPYLAIATLGLAVVFTPLTKLDELAEWTGGRDGINLFARKFGPPVDWGWLTNERWYYFMAMAGVAITVLLAYNLLSSSVGRAFRAVRDNEVAAAAMGINVARTKLAAFALSSAYAGFAGGLFFLLSNRFVAPESFSVLLAIEYLMAIVIGGMASISGSLLGAFALVYVFRPGGMIETVASQTEEGNDIWLLLAGALLAAWILFQSGVVSRLTQRYRAWLKVQYDAVRLNLVRLGIGAAMLVAAIAGGIVFTALVRLAAEEVVDLVALRGAISGGILILIVLFLPQGFIGLVWRVQRLTWAGIRNQIKQAVWPQPEVVAPEARPAPGVAGGSANPLGLASQPSDPPSEDGEGEGAASSGL